MATLAAPQYGQNTDIDATAEQLTTDNIRPRQGVWIKALASNSNNVYVGLSDQVTATTGYELDAGQEMIVSYAEVQDASEIWVIGGAANQGVCWRVV